MKTSIRISVEDKMQLKNGTLDVDYTFFSYKNTLKLTAFSASTTDPIFRGEEKGWWRSYISVYPDSIIHHTRDKLYWTDGTLKSKAKPLIHVPEWDKIYKLEDVEVPEHVWQAVRNKLKRLRI